MDIETRLRRLELTNRLLLTLLLLIAVYSTIGKVNAEGHPRRIIADSVETHSLSVVNPYGKQGVTIDVGDSGMVGLGFSDVQTESNRSPYSQRPRVNL